MKKFYWFLLFVFLCKISEAQVDFIAHRGASYLAPENTVAANKLAWELGADAVEIDIHLSKDNKVMVIHDGDTRKVSGTYLKVSETNSKVLRTLDVGSFKDEKYKGEKIPFLEEIIQIIPSGQKLVIELKSRKEIIPRMKKIIDKCCKTDQLIFICFDWETIVVTKQAFPNNTCYWLCNDKTELMSRMNDVARLGLEGVDLKYSIIDEEVMAQANKLHLNVVAYTVNDPKEARRLIELGVKGITTDRPAWLKEQIYALRNDTLRYSENGTFKIVQFTDNHYNSVKSTVDNEPCKNLMKKIIDEEQPDLVVFTGDLVSGDCADHKKWIAECIKTVIDKKQRWALTWGNHDSEGETSRSELMEMVINLPYSLCKMGPENIEGVSNYVLPVYGCKSNKVENVLYFLDSNARTQTNVGGEDWIRPNQIAWYRSISEQFKKENNGKPVPSVAFFHIPVPEFKLAWDLGLCKGHQYETPCCPTINSGFFAAALEQGDIKGMIVGHDHANDYEGTLCGIRLCYGRVTGYRCYAIQRKDPSVSKEEDDRWRGARVILLKEGGDDFETWIRNSANEVVRYE